MVAWLRNATGVLTAVITAIILWLGNTVHSLSLDSIRSLASLERIEDRQKTYVETVNTQFLHVDAQIATLRRELDEMRLQVQSNRVNMQRLIDRMRLTQEEPTQR